MKHKKLFSILASAVMAMAIAAPSFAFADEDDPPATRFSNDSTATLVLENAKKDDEFTAYKLIDITYDAATNSISYSWDPQISGCINDIYQNSEIHETPKNPFTVEDYINLQTEQRKMLLASLFNHIHDKNAHSEADETGHVIKPITIDGYEGNNVKAVVGEDKKATWTNVSMGGYFIEPVTTTDVYEFIFKAVQPEADADGNYTLDDTTDFSISTKHNPMSIQKYTNIPESDHISGTAESSDVITYYIFADVPKYGMNALQKSFSIKDDIPDGITINEDSITVKANPTNTTDLKDANWVTMDKDKTYTLTSTAAQNHTKDFTVSIENTDDNKQFDKWYQYTIDKKGKYNANPNYAKILITYTAYLNDKAVLTEKTTTSENETTWKGNKNTATLTYMPFPYIEEGGKIKTNSVSDSFTVYTYGLEIWKYDGETGLSGAHFKLTYPKADGTEEAEVERKVTDVYYRNSTEDKWQKIDETTDLVTKDGHLYIKGLKGDTNYILEETKAPAEYNLPAESDRKKTISIDTLPKSVALEGTQESGQIQKSANAGYVYQPIENNKGFTLPETGGTGVMILKILGIVAMAVAVIVVAVVLLHPKKKATDK